MDLELLESPNCAQINEYDSLGRVIKKMPVDCTAAFGAPWLLNHRIALHKELLRLATSGNPALPGVPAKVISASKVVSIDAENASVTLEDGKVMKADVVIGADGIKSTASELVLGHKATARPSGHSAYRLLIPFERLRKLNDPEIEAIISKPSLSMFVAEDRRVVCYTCRFKGVDQLNVVAMVPDAKLNEASSESWFEPGNVEDLLKSFDEFGRLPKQILSQTTECGLYQLRDQDPLDRWCRGRLIIIGDAAHPMLPHLGQGGSQAIEDAEALAYILGPETTNASVEEALERVFRLRHHRSTIAQERSRLQALGPRKIAAETGMNTELGLDTYGFTKYLYDYFGARDWEAKEKSRA